MHRFTVSLIAGFALAMSAHAQEDMPSGDEMKEAMNALGALFGAAAQAGASTNQAIHQRQLRDLLPAEFNGMARSNTEAGKNAMFGMNMSYAQATYAKDEASINVKISDISSMGEFVKMAQYAWTANEMERETDDGYERTTKVDGHPAQERFDSRYKQADLQIMVDGRFMVELDGSNVEMAALQDLVKAIDLKKLAALKPQPPQN